MRNQPRLWLVVLLILLVSLIATTTQASATNKGPSGPPVCKGNLITAAELRPFSKSVWDQDRWERDRPAKKTIVAYKHKLQCAAGPGHRKAMKKRWRKDKKLFEHYADKLRRHFINYTWEGVVYPHPAWHDLPELKPYVAAALAEAAGDYTGTNMPGWTMVQMSMGEGHLKPGSRSTDCGYGWLAITCPYGDEYGVHSLGGYGEMLNPVKNAYIAALMLARQGFGAWYGDGHVTDWDAHYTGKFDIRDALGGLTFGQALKAG